MTYEQLAKEYLRAKKINKKIVEELRKIKAYITMQIERIEDQEIGNTLYKIYCYDVGNPPYQEFEEKLFEQVRKLARQEEAVC